MPLHAPLGGFILVALVHYYVGTLEPSDIVAISLSSLQALLPCFRSSASHRIQQLDMGVEVAMMRTDQNFAEYGKYT
jgi:hypothetical protein